MKNLLNFFFLSFLLFSPNPNNTLPISRMGWWCLCFCGDCFVKSFFSLILFVVGFAKKKHSNFQNGKQKSIRFHFWPREISLFLISDFKKKIQLGVGEDEIQRQNRITAQIVANYLERRLFPFKRPTHRLPTVDEILPTAAQLPNQHSTAESKTKITRQLEHGSNTGLPPPDNDDIGDDDYVNDDNNNEQDIDPNDPENLQTVESNHVDSYYNEMNDSISNDNEGRFFSIYISHAFFFLSLNNVFSFILILKKKNFTRKQENPANFYIFARNAM